jgi:hypothetical protein
LSFGEVRFEIGDTGKALGHLQPGPKDKVLSHGYTNKTLDIQRDRTPLGEGLQPG